MPATRHQLLARLHCLKKEHGWDEDTYRDILQARTGQRSAAALSGPALARAVAALGGQKPAPAGRQPHEWSWVDTAAEARRPLLRKLIMLVRSARDKNDQPIRKGGQVRYIEGIAAQMAGYHAKGAGPVEKPLPLCDEGELWRIVQAVAVQVRRQGGDPNALDA